MLILLPDSEDGLPDLEKTLSLRMLHECVEGIDVREVRLFMRRFKMTRGVNLSGPLSTLGMPLEAGQVALDAGHASRLA
jgi:hypothetical protein